MGKHLNMGTMGNTGNVAALLLALLLLAASVAYAPPSASAQTAKPKAGAKTAPQPTPKVPQKKIDAANDFFKDIDFDQLVEDEKAAVDRVQKKLIRNFEPIRFTAGVKRYPEEKKMDYIYTAMEVSGVKPLPDVSHRMFVTTGRGRIVSVYVERQAAALIRSGMKEGAKVRFLGYHVYSYAKGPAILIVGFSK
ncbi:MAG: hypothetical protein LBP68_08105 [Acidobacteriota bacterium]|jgi:hypothetical protein|nr:hypothetical protein [Acidobacteriota bacterium]